jgi:hypothetical protein
LIYGACVVAGSCSREEEARAAFGVAFGARGDEEEDG